ncbi:MAG TPA: hypothetical protein VMJ34_16145 [Bryobacteraceae bacterium]|nr:hypothetical protein [Bryobacteraceae bacterium]
MNFKTWKYFFGAVFLAGALLLKFGAPLMPLLIGVAAAGLITFRKARRSA